MDENFFLSVIEYNTVRCVTRRMENLEFVRANLDDIAIFQGAGAMEEVGFLVVIFPPRGPGVTGINEIFPYAVQGNLTVGLLLYESVPSNMVTMGVGIYDQLDVREVDT